ncbi:MAG: peptide ABC transporter substrate-binding protein [Neisseria sp.]|nr:peptide ABC transporter substrate-binding protein [Neisseria sp.]
MRRTKMTALKYPVLCVSLAAVFGLAACGGGEKKEAAAFERANHDRVVVSNSVEPGSLDPQKSGDMAAGAVIRQLMEGLAATDAEGKTIPALAEKWESDADGKVWTFYLRDAKWSNGDPVTADDFVYSFRRLADPATGAPFASYLADAQVENADEVLHGKAKPEMLGVKAVDAKTLQFTLTAPVPYFPDMMIQQFTYPVHRASVEKYGDKWTQPGNYVSSGAYVLKEWQVNSHIAMTRNPAYYDKDKVAIAEVVFLPGGNEYDRYRANEVDVTYGVPGDRIAAAEGEFPGQLRRTTVLCSWYLSPNHAAAPFDNPKVRQALSLITDRDIVAKVSGRGDMPAYQLTPPDMQGVGRSVPDWQSWSKERRVAEAKRLLNEAGYDESRPLEFEILYSTSESAKKQTTALQSLWKSALPFVKAKLSNQEWKTYLDTYRQGAYSLAFGGWCSDYNDPSGMLNIFRSNNANNGFKYKNAEFDRILNSTLTAGASADGRVKAYTDAEALLQKDAAFIPLYHQVAVRLVKPDIRGYADKDPLLNYRVRDWSFAPKQ